MDSKDVIIIGGGHNGLVCAYYLARKGLSVTVLERRHIVGGAAVTEEFHPGFRNSVASYTVSLLNPKIIRDLSLKRHGLRIVERRLSNFLPLENGYFKVGPGIVEKEIAKFSTKDAERFAQFSARTEVLADVLRDLILKTPPNFGSKSWLASITEAVKSLPLLNNLRKLKIESQRDLLTLFGKSAGDILDHWFESDPIKASWGFDAVVGTYASPYTPGSAYVMLHHAFGEVNGKKGVWGHAIGGMGAITQAMAKACAEVGVDVRLSSPVSEVIVDPITQDARGVVTEAGDKILGSIVVSNLNPKLLYQKLIDPAYLPEDFKNRIVQWRCCSGTFRMNVALSELPRFTCLPEVGDHHTSGIIIGPSLAYMDRAYTDAQTFRWSLEPIIEMLIPSTLDDTLAPPGQHVASLFCQHVKPEGVDWSKYKTKVAKLMIGTVARHAPGFEKSILGMQVLSPTDLEDMFGLVGGDIFHGNLSIDQMFSARPVLGYGDYRSPIAGLYMCGSGTHPGGGVTGAPGHNAAREILKDLGY